MTAAAAAPTAFIHCALATSAYWRPVARAAGIAAPILIDLVGHGAAPDWDPAQDYQAQARDHALACLPAAPVHLVGHSYGGCVALRLALDHPDRVVRLTLIEPVFFAAARGTAAHAEDAAAFTPVAEAWAAGDAARAAALFHGLWGDGRPLSDLPDRMRRYVIRRFRLIPAGAVATRDDNAGQLAPGRLEGLDRPVTIVTGDRSPAVVQAIASTLAARLPQARRVTLDGAGHMAPATHPAAVAALL